MADPIGQMRAVYQQLELGDFDRVLPAIEKYFADKADYQTNRFQLAPGAMRRDRPPLAVVLDRYGYAAPPGAAGRAEAGQAAATPCGRRKIPATSFGIPPRPPAEGGRRPQPGFS